MSVAGWLVAVLLAAADEASSSPVEDPSRASAITTEAQARELRKRRDRDTPAAPSAPAATSDCCWSFNSETKRYQFYIKPATATACVSPYKPAACPKPPPPPATVGAVGGAGAASTAVAAATHPPTPRSLPPQSVHRPPPPPQPPPPLFTPPPPLQKHVGPKSATKAAKAAAEAASATAAAAAAAATAASAAASPAEASHGTTAAAPPPTSPRSASSGGGGSFMSGLLKLCAVLAAACLAWKGRASIGEKLDEFFPAGKSQPKSLAAGAKPGSTPNYKRVQSSRSDGDETLSQTSCGLAEEELDPAAEEWAARLAAQREGREYKPAASAGAGAGAVPSFGAAGGAAAAPAAGAGSARGFPPVPAPEEDFGGFDGFDQGGGGGGSACARGVGGSSAPTTPAPGGQQRWGGVQLDVKELEGMVQQPAPVDDIDWGSIARARCGPTQRAI